MVNVTVGIPGVASIGLDATELLSRLGDLSKPVVIVKRDDRGLSFDTGLTTHGGAPLTVWSLHGEAHQLWYLVRRQKGSVSIRSAQTDLVLTGTRRMVNGDVVRMQEWTNKPWQRWYLRPLDESRAFAIVSAEVGSGYKAMDVPTGAERGAHVQVWEWWDGPQQKFMLLRPQEG